MLHGLLAGNDDCGAKENSAVTTQAEAVYAQQLTRDSCLRVSDEVSPVVKGNTCLLGR